MCRHFNHLMDVLKDYKYLKVFFHLYSAEHFALLLRKVFHFGGDCCKIYTADKNEFFSVKQKKNYIFFFLHNKIALIL